MNETGWFEWAICFGALGAGGVIALLAIIYFWYPWRKSKATSEKPD